MVKKRNLTQQKIIEASISLINESGLDALTMRALAAKLGVQASAVYWHVKNKEELLQLLSVFITRQVSFPLQDLDWKSKLIHLAEDSRKAMSALRNGPEIMMQTIPADPTRLGLIEYMLKVLIDAGFSPAKSLEIANLLNNYTIFYTMDAFMREEQQKDPSFQEQIQGFMAGVARHYPNFHQAMLEQVSHTSSGGEFQSGLLAILNGYEQALHQPGGMRSN